MSASPEFLPSQYAHAVWRASQMGAYRADVLASGHALLDGELPHGGWPTGTLIELLTQQPGIGELRLLQPALATLPARRRIALVAPPYLPQTAAWQSWGGQASQLLWVRTQKTADALWSAEQILRNGSCGALLLWQQHIRTESLRRLHLAAQSCDVAFWLLRPLPAAQDASPSPLRLVLRPAPQGLSIDIIKRRGPQLAQPLVLPLPGLPGLPDAPLAAPSDQVFSHASVDRSASAAAATGRVSATLV